MALPRQKGKPSVFISQGKWDTVSPIEQYSPPIVQQLIHADYDVQYHEVQRVAHTSERDRSKSYKVVYSTNTERKLTIL